MGFAGVQRGDVLAFDADLARGGLDQSDAQIISYLQWAASALAAGRARPTIGSDRGKHDLTWVVRKRFALVDRCHCCIYDKYVATFDPKKSKLNKDKHGVVLETCEEALDGDMLTLEDTREDYGEQRFVSLGWAAGKVVVLVWTDREEGPRLISCREAKRHEQKAYFQAYPHQ